ncbi:MAG: DUF3667 domain-containing protein [Vicingaceae bacterium]
MESKPIKTVDCLNCDSANLAGGHFCSHCGQRLDLPRITFLDIIQDLLSSEFNWDAPYLKTTREVFLRPGATVRKIIGGKRKQYYAPIRFLVISMLINIIISKVIGFDPIENQKLISGSSETPENVNFGYQIGQFLAKHLNIFVLIFPFTIAFFSKLFFWKARFNLAERTVFGFYLSGLYVLISLIPVLLTLVNPQLINLSILFNIAFNTFAFHQFHQSKRKVLSVFKSLLAAAFSLFSYFFVAAIISWIIMMQFNLFT